MSLSEWVIVPGGWGASDFDVKTVKTLQTQTFRGGTPLHEVLLSKLLHCIHHLEPRLQSSFDQELFEINVDSVKNVALETQPLGPQGFGPADVQRIDANIPRRVLRQVLPGVLGVVEELSPCCPAFKHRKLRQNECICVSGFIHIHIKASSMVMYSMDV